MKWMNRCSLTNWNFKVRIKSLMNFFVAFGRDIFKSILSHSHSHIKQLPRPFFVRVAFATLNTWKYFWKYERFVSTFFNDSNRTAVHSVWTSVHRIFRRHRSNFEQVQRAETSQHAKPQPICCKVSAFLNSLSLDLCEDKLAVKFCSESIWIK